MKGPAEKGETPEVRRARVLIVGSTSDLSLMVEPFLMRKGFSVYLAFTLSDALRAARAEYFNLVIINLEMPKNEAGCVCEALRGIAGYLGTPIIIINDPLPAGENNLPFSPCFSASINRPINLNALSTLIEGLS